MTDSLLNYIGHKSKIVKQIIEYFPEEISGTFYDLFAGSCVVGLSVPYERIVCVEKNPHLSQLYRDLTHPNFLVELLRILDDYNLTNSSVVPRSQYLKDPNIGTVTWHGETVSNFHLDQLNKDGYRRLIDDFNGGVLNGLERSVGYLVLTLYGRNSSVGTKDDGSLSGGVGPLDYSIRAHRKFEEHCGILKGGRHRFVTGSYSDIEIGVDDFVYMDPPYLASSYHYSGWGEDDERALLRFIDSLPCRWALSNTFQSGDRCNRILEEWSGGRTVISIDKKYRKWAAAGLTTAHKRDKINREVLILSDPPTTSFGNGLFTFA